MSLVERVNFGWVPQLPDHRDRMLAMPDMMAAALPPKVDLRSKHTFAVLDQGQLGSCVAHAVGSAIEFAQHTRPNDANVPDFLENDRKFPTSRLFLYYEARKAIGMVSEDSGCVIRDALRVAYNMGVPRETGWKYDIAKYAKAPPKHSYKSAPFHKITSYKAVPVSVSGVKAALAQGFPVVFGVAVFNSFFTGDGNIPMPNYSDQVIGGHAMLAVGYDDSTNRFDILNSWGVGWGVNGFGTIPYNYLGNPMLGDDYWTLQDEQYKERME
ncbi:MAG: C1 family peptidase [Bacteroidota bacterium]